MKHGWCIVVLVAVGCAGPKSGPNGAAPGAPPHDMATGDHVPKTPPVGTGGGPTAAGCNGVTEKGRCEISDKGQVAVVCDVAAGQLQRFDCSAMQKVCVIDSTRGATCATLPPPVTPGGASDGGVHPPVPADMAHVTPPPAPRDMATSPPPPAPRDMATAPPMCASGVDYRGYCASATASGASDTAIWCDPSTGQTLVINCAATGKTCQIDACADGAYCCASPVSVDMATPPTMNAECDALGYNGACQSGHARWCSGGQVFDIDCGARGQDCAVDQCAQGAYCCEPTSSSPPDMTPAPDATECDRLGIEGECAAGVARWCSGGQIIEVDCGARAQTCEVDTCATGAYCCSG
jgi:hypothetical protein